MLSCAEHVFNGGGELVRPGARNDDGVAPAMRFLGDAKKSSPIVLAEFHIEVLPLDLNLLRFYNIIHVGRSVAGYQSLGKEKISLNFTAPNG